VRVGVISACSKVRHEKLKRTDNWISKTRRHAASNFHSEDNTPTRGPINRQLGDFWVVLYVEEGVQHAAKWC
jgi:hypothetical protein